MFTRAEIKQQAKEQLKGNVWMLLLCAFVMVVIATGATMIGAFIPFVGSLAATFLVVAPLSYGLYVVYLNVTYGERPQVGKLFEGFQNFGPVVLLYFLIWLFTMLWTLLFVIPGIIKTLSYSMAYYVLAENPQMSANEALNESKAIMDGHKMDLFVLYLSSIPWMLLGSITLGIAYIYVMPYMQLTITNFYHKIKRPSTAVPAQDVVTDSTVM